MIRVALVDDQALIRGGLRALLDAEPGFEVVGEAADGEAALVLIRAQRPDVVLMDIRMPILDGLEATRRIAADEALAHVRVVVLTTFELDEYVFAALRAGASGFLLKDEDPAALLRALRAAATGDALLSPSVTRRVVETFSAGAPPSGPALAGLEELTEREREIVALVGTGLVEPRDRRAARDQPGDRADPRLAGDAQARGARPRPGRRVRVRIRARHPGSRHGVAAPPLACVMQSLARASWWIPAWLGRWLPRFAGRGRGSSGRGAAARRSTATSRPG